MTRANTRAEDILTAIAYKREDFKNNVAKRLVGGPVRMQELFMFDKPLPRRSWRIPIMEENLEIR